MLLYKNIHHIAIVIGKRTIFPLVTCCWGDTKTQCRLWNNLQCLLSSLCIQTRCALNYLLHNFAWWNAMEALSPSLALCEKSSVTGEYPSQRPVTWCFDVFFDLRLNKRWVNNRDAGDLRRHRAHYDVTIMWGRIAHTYVSQLGHHCSSNGLATVRR